MVLVPNDVEFPVIFKIAKSDVYWFTRSSHLNRVLYFYHVRARPTPAVTAWKNWLKSSSSTSSNRKKSGLEMFVYLKELKTTGHLKKSEVKSCSGSDVMSLMWFGDDVTLVPLPENDENFLYFPYKSENPNTSISGVVLHASRKIVTESKYNKIVKIFIESCKFWLGIWRHEYHIGQNGPKF